MLAPNSGWSRDLTGKDGHADGDIKLLPRKVRRVTFKVKARGGGSCISKPIKRDVIEHLIARKLSFWLIVGFGPLGELLIYPRSLTGRRIRKAIANRLRSCGL